MTAAVKLYPAVRSAVGIGGTPIIAMYGPFDAGGMVLNPYSAADQGLNNPEVLFVSILGDADIATSVTTVALQPGQSFTIPPGTTTNLSVNALSDGHKFSAFSSSGFTTYLPPTGNFPPAGPTTLTKAIKSYIYEEYSDDPDLPAFNKWFNVEAQEYADWFASIGLPVYTGDALSGELLDWIGAGFYGYPRPVLPSGRNKNIGPLNTWTPNTVTPNEFKVVGNQNFYATTDDVYKRCLTWHLYKGDGKYFTVRWLKRRVMRFLTGTNGTSPDVSDTSPVSVTFGNDGTVNITILAGLRTVVKSAMPNSFAPNTVTPNEIKTMFTPFQPLLLAPILKSAIESGALELPFQFNFVVNVS